MKKIMFIACLWLSYPVLAQDKSRVVDNKVHYIVMQFTSGDSLQQRGIMTQLGNIREAWPNAKVEVVCHSGGLDLLTTKKSKVAEQIAEFYKQGIVFAACANTMRLRNVKKEELVPTHTIIPSAMIELVQKQEAKWSYVKGGF